MAMNGGARCLYGNKPNGNWHNAIKRLSLRLFRCSVFSVGICAHLRAFYHTLVYPTLSLALANLQTLFFSGSSSFSVLLNRHASCISICIYSVDKYFFCPILVFITHSFSLRHRKLCHARILTNCKKNAD